MTFTDHESVLNLADVSHDTVNILLCTDTVESSAPVSSNMIDMLYFVKFLNIFLVFKCNFLSCQRHSDNEI